MQKETFTLERGEGRDKGRMKDEFGHYSIDTQMEWNMKRRTSRRLTSKAPRRYHDSTSG